MGNLIQITHVYSHYRSGNAEEERRKSLARQTWIHTYKKGGWLPLPVLSESLPRLFNEGSRRLPYIKDLINETLHMPGEYVCLTNSDTCFAPSMHSRIVNWSLAFKPTLPICCNRKDFDRIDAPLTDEDIQNCGSQYPGIDLFLFQKDWWLSIRRTFPDMILGREAWDAIFWVAMRERGGYSIPNLIYHESHGNTWEQPHNRYALHGQLYNLTLASEWLRNKGLDARSFGIRDVPNYFEMPLPTTQETPHGGWRVSYKGIFITHPYCFETVFNNTRLALKAAGIDIPPDLKEIITRQSCYIICPRFSS